MVQRMYLAWDTFRTYSGLLVVGTVIALIWAQVSPESYEAFKGIVLIEDFFIGHLHDGHRTLTVGYLVNEVLMPLFFFAVGKEVWEAIRLKNGSLRGKKAVTPLVTTTGGVVGPVAVYLGIAVMMGSTVFDAVFRGWATSTATDIMFSLIVGRIVFGAGHPAIRFLLLLAIADDAIGLLILAIFYPSGELAPSWLLVSFAASFGAFVTCNWLPRQLDGRDPNRPYSTWMRRRLGAWPYIIAGCISWYAFQESGIHPALGLLPIIPAIPHADRDFGIFAASERHRTDLLNHIEHRLKIPVEIVLLLFGLMNAGVSFSAMGEATWLVMAGLVVGKPIGILVFGMIAVFVLRLELPEGMSMRDVFVLGCVAGIGFTVALFVASVAFPAGPLQDAAKMGALFSFGSAAVAIIAGRLLGIKRIP